VTCIALLVIAVAADLLAQPGIGQNGVVNAASQIPPTLPGGALARGARFTIYGVRLGAGGQSTSITISSLHVNALSVSPTRIEAALPGQIPLGANSLVVTVDGLRSKSFPIVVVASNPGIYSRNGLGWGPGRIANMDAQGRLSDNTLTASARPGQRIRIATTGLGNAAEAIVVVGNRTVPVRRHAAEDDLIVQIPAGTPAGCYVPLFLETAPRRASNVVTISINPAGRPCDSGPIGPLSEKNLGVAVLARSRMLGRKASADSIDDEATAVFAGKSGQPVLSPLLLLPPPGTCTAYTSSLQATTVLPNTISAALVAELEGRGLEAGSKLIVSRKGDQRVVSRVRGSPGYYRARLGTGGAGVGPRSLPLFLEPGTVTIAGAGGEQVGPFEISVPAPSSFEWTNRAQSGIVDRDKPLSLRWSGIANDRTVVIVATNVGQLSTAIGTCLCTVRASANRFTIPPSLLANIPESVDMPGIPYDQLFLASLPASTPPKLDAQGLAGGAVFSIYAIGRVVQFK
jgi:uncharacterized protein (TIGR03437 family)